MKTTISLILIVLVALLAACSPASVIEKDYTGFDKVALGNAFTVDISQGESFSVVLNVGDNLVEYLEVSMEGDTLKIGLKEGGDIIRGRKNAEITMPELTSLSLSGSSDGTITGFKSTQVLEVSLSGDSSLQGEVEAGDTSFNVSGGSRATLSGSGQNLTVAAGGGSTVDLSKFSTSDANVSAGGDSEVTVNTSGKLDAQADGNSTVYYLGNPTLGTINSTGSSEVRPK
jgi:hypothetical protein